jgi:hypothetical protein
VKSIIKKVEESFWNKKRARERTSTLNNLKSRFVEVLNHSGLDKQYEEGSIYGWTEPIQVMTKLDGLSFTISVRSDSEPSFSLKSSNPEDYVKLSKFIPKFLEVWEVSSL